MTECGGELEPKASDLGIYSPSDFWYSPVPWHTMTLFSPIANMVVTVMDMDGFDCASFYREKCCCSFSQCCLVSYIWCSLNSKNPMSCLVFSCNSQKIIEFARWSSFPKRVMPVSG